MDVFFNLLIVNFKQGLLYGVLALGVYITYSILDFPDLSVDGTVPLGGVVSAILILKGVNPWLEMCIRDRLYTEPEPSAPGLLSYSSRRPAGRRRSAQ